MKRYIWYFLKGISLQCYLKVLNDPIELPVASCLKLLEETDRYKNCAYIILSPDNKWLPP